MSRIERINPQKAEGTIRKLLEAVRRRVGMTPNLIRTMACSAATLAGYLGLDEALGKGALSSREREQIALAVAEANGCGYCLAAHTASGKLFGLSELEVCDARRGSATAKREDAILKFAGEVLARRGHVRDNELRRVRRAGLTDGEITEIVANVALNVFTNYMTEVAATKVDFPPAAVVEACEHLTHPFQTQNKKEQR
ncbi:MAG TPA: carboxymuconolactone decarboxylase family protein [Acidobacteriota bacterium]|nr:carboxymuconolactone decarboxylase family protein [Acidobacteriota bacterium]